MKKFLIENWIILVIGFFLMTSMTVAIRNNYVIEQNYQLQQQIALIRQRTRDILSQIMHGLDMGVRGYGLTKKKDMLRPYEEALTTAPIIFSQLDSLLKQQDYPHRPMLENVRYEVQNYMNFCKKMVMMAETNNTTQFLHMLSQDKGYEVWTQYNAFAIPLVQYEDKLNEQSLAAYKAAIRNNVLLQAVMLILALPLLYVFILRIKKERDARAGLLLKVEENDRQFVFNPGTQSLGNVNNNAIQNVKKASQFIGQMAGGNYEINWEGLDHSNFELNKETLAGNLVALRNTLRKVKHEEEKRNWINEGLTSFADIVRTHQHDPQLLYDRCISFLSRYIQAQQAGLFLPETDHSGENVLVLHACYAFNRKKFLTKRIAPGQGLIGQVFLEGQPIRLTEIPNGYTHITSGLGEAMPRNIAIVPFKHQSQVNALIELASFHALEDHHLLFLSKAGEYLASFIANANTYLKMKHHQESSVPNKS